MLAPTSTDMAENATKLPYQPGTSIELEVIKDYGGLPFSRQPTITITNVFSVTMSPVMEVVINDEHGHTIRAVLKLYDRRFGTHLREVLGKHVPHTADRERAFQSFVKDGSIAPFLSEYGRERELARVPLTPGDVYDGPAGGIFRYEAALWQECIDYFTSETMVYERLVDFQGSSIPRMHAQVRIASPGPSQSEGLHGLQSPLTSNPYFEIKGVIMELIAGYSLRDLPISPMAPRGTSEWAVIVQAAVDATHHINKRGVLLNDCHPRNVMVNQRTQTPFIMDFAQCDLKEKIIKRAEKEIEELSSESQDDDWDPNVEYWEQVRGADNTGAIGSVMAKRIFRLKGMKLAVKYPPYDGIIDGLNRSNGRYQALQGLR